MTAIDFVKRVVDALDVQYGKLDLDYVRGWCDLHGTRQLFEQLQEQAARANS